MITIKGKYNSANIMIDDIDPDTRDQIQTFLNHPAFANTYISIMPDCHVGIGAVIGLTMKMNDYIIPNVIGVDIGCGMLSSCFGNISFDPAVLDTFIRDKIPSGFNINKEFAKVDQHFEEKILDVCDRLKLDITRVFKSIGSLGGGNHFIEAGRDEDNNLWITIHSGSRNFGLRISNYYQNLARQELEKKSIKNVNKGLEFLIVNSKSGKGYIQDLNTAQAYAAINRKIMMKRIIKKLNIQPIEEIESVHNFIKDGIIRKGATSALAGEKVIIPFNMKDGIAIGIGKGNALYNFSAPHGAGRILSRSKAKEILKLDKFKAEMKAAGIYSTSINKHTLDEAPGAYKSKDVILENISETVDVVKMIKPVYNFKSGK